MWDTIAIIVLLGGLEYALWLATTNHDRKMEREDAITQQKQIDILDGILTELAIINSTDITPVPSQEQHAGV